MSSSFLISSSFVGLEVKTNQPIVEDFIIKKDLRVKKMNMWKISHWISPQENWWKRYEYYKVMNWLGLMIARILIRVHWIFSCSRCFSSINNKKNPWISSSNYWGFPYIYFWAKCGQPNHRQAATSLHISVWIKWKCIDLFLKIVVFFAVNGHFRKTQNWYK